MTIGGRVGEALRGKPYLPGVLAVGLIALVYLPSLGTFLQGDDFEWLDASYQGWRSPGQLLVLINGFFRPVVKLSYLLDYTLFGTKVLFYNLTNLLIHLGAVLLLYTWCLRMTRRILPALLTSLLFGLSAYYSEVTLWSASRMEAMLLMSFLGVLLLLQGQGQGQQENPKGHSRLRSGLVIGLALLAAGIKETWVLIPVLATAFLIMQERQGLKTTLRRTSGLWLLLALYLAYFVGLPLMTGAASPTAYGQLDIPRMIQKLGFLLAKYVGLGEHFSGELWQPVVALLVLALLAWRLIRTANRPALLGGLWMLVTIAISLPVFHAPSRYSYLPLVGFWIMVVAFCDHELGLLLQRFPARKLSAGLLLATTVVFYLAYHSIMLQWEIRDYRVRGELHKVLADRYLEIRDRVPTALPILFIDLGRRRAVDETQIALKGYRKLLFRRDDAIWQQVKLAPLANFLGDPLQQLLRPVAEDQLAASLQGPVSTLIFTDEHGFALVAGDGYRVNVRDYYLSHQQLPFKVELLQHIPVAGRDQKEAL